MLVKDELMVFFVNTQTFIAKKIMASLYDSCSNSAALCQFILQQPEVGPVYTVVSLEHANGDKSFKEATFVLNNAESSFIKQSGITIEEEVKSSEPMGSAGGSAPRFKQSSK